MQWNNGDMTANLKLICSALNLSRADIAEIVGMGGMQISKSRADSWLRGASATKNATGNSDVSGSRVNRTDTIKPDEFHAFCVGLKPWLDSVDTDDNV